MLNLIIGGVITLVGAVLVQILIIPSVQRRTRKRERWERDITGLQALMENDFPKHFRTLRRAIVPYLSLQALPDKYRADAVNHVAYKTAAADAIAAHDELRDTAWQAMWLARRAAIYKPGQDPYWSRLLTDLATLLGSVELLAPEHFTKNPDTDATEFERLLNEAHRAQGLIYGTLAYTADPLEPPKAQHMSKLRRRLRGLARRIMVRLGRRPSIPPGQISDGPPQVNMISEQAPAAPLSGGESATTALVANHRS